jgi:hypothetical protein
MTCDGDGDGSAFLSNFKPGVCQFQRMFVAFPASVNICVGLLGNLAVSQLVELKTNSLLCMCAASSTRTP